MGDDEFAAAVEETCSPSAKMIESLREQVAAQQARIAELRGALVKHQDQTRLIQRTLVALFHTDDLSALAAHDAEVKKAALLDLAGMFEQAGWDDVPGRLRRMAEGK